MAKVLIINWKWALPLKEASMSGHSIWNSVDGEFVVICINTEREEVFFEEEEEEIYAEANQALWEYLCQIEVFKAAPERVYLLHSNDPNFFGQFDIGWFQEKDRQGKVHLFGGGDDWVYHLRHDNGLLDQVGGFAAEAISNAEQQLLENSAVNAVWDYYNSSIIQSIYLFSRKVLPYLLPNRGESIPPDIQEEASMLSGQVMAASWTPSHKKELQHCLESIGKGDASKVNSQGFSILIETLCFSGSVVGR